MKSRFLAVVIAAGVAMAGCNDKAVINNKPLTDEEKRQIAAEDQRINDEESPGNKTLKHKPGKKK